MIPFRFNPMGINRVRSKTTWVIAHGAGVLDIGITGASELLWTFPDRSTSGSARPAKTVTAGTTVITCSDFSVNNLVVTIHPTATALSAAPIPARSLPDLRWQLTVYMGLAGAISDLPEIAYSLTLLNLSGLTGSTADLPRVAYYLYMFNLPGLTGSIADVPRVTNSLVLNNLSNLTGATADLPRVDYYLLLSDLSGLTGAISDLPTTSFALTLVNLPNIAGSTADLPRVGTYLSLNNLPGLTGAAADLPGNTGEKRAVNCDAIIGAMQVAATNPSIYYYGNDMVAPGEYDTTIANCVAAGASGKTLYISSRKTSASDADVATLIGRGWTVNSSQI